MLLSRRVATNEPELLELIADVLDISQDVTWAVDRNAGGAGLLIALLVNHGQKPRCKPCQPCARCEPHAGFERPPPRGTGRARCGRGRTATRLRRRTGVPIG